MSSFDISMPEEDSRSRRVPDQNSMYDNEATNEPALSSDISLYHEPSFLTDQEPSNNSCNNSDEEPDDDIQYEDYLMEIIGLEVEITSKIRREYSKKMQKMLQYKSVKDYRDKVITQEKIAIFNMEPPKNIKLREMVVKIINEEEKSLKNKVNKLNIINEANIRWTILRANLDRAETNLPPLEVPEINQPTIKREHIEFGVIQKPAWQPPALISSIFTKEIENSKNNDKVVPSKKMKLASPEPLKDAANVSCQIVGFIPKRKPIPPLILTQFEKTYLSKKIERYYQIAKEMQKLEGKDNLTISSIQNLE